MPINAIAQQKHTAPDLNNVATPLHGSGGLFAVMGLENPLLSLVLSPMGVGDFLPAFPKTVTDPRYGFLYSIDDEAGSEPDNICDDAIAADLSSATLTTAFGHVQRATKTIELATAAFTLNADDSTDLMLLGAPGTPLNPQAAGTGYPTNVTTQDMLNNLFRAQMVAASYSMQRAINTMVWQGNPASATANGGYIPFNGILNLVKTGHTDAETAGAIPKADSIVVDAAYEDLESSATFDIVKQLRSIITALDTKGMGLIGLPTYAICMRPELWDRLSDVWPIQYGGEMAAAMANDRSSTASVDIVMDANSLVAARDQMKASNTIVINGRTHLVVPDHGLPLNDNAADVSVPVGSWGSHIVIIPLSAGGIPLTYWEYLDWRVSMAYLQAIQAEGLAFWTDGGRFLWTSDQAKTCVKFQTRVRPRIVLRAPHLAARIDDITWVQSAVAFPTP